MPLLVLLLAYEEHEAAGTSLGAIAVIAALATTLHALYGNVDVSDGLLIGAPAVLGVIAGTALQQRLSSRAVSGAFSALLVASAAYLIV